MRSAPKVAHTPSVVTLTENTELWVLKDEPDWKNDILLKYQKALIKGGIKNADHRKILVQQMFQESGVNVLPVGDNGCSFGILQKNACASENQLAKIFLSKNPEWKDIDFQVNYWATTISGVYAEMSGDIRLTAVFHNRPRSAREKQYHKACDGVDSYRFVSGRGWSCYFADEVMDPDIVQKVIPYSSHL